MNLLSVVIPAYNEAPRIGQTLRAVSAYLKGQPYRWEIVVVNDGSRDNTQAEVFSLMKAIPQLHFLGHATNQGKGAAICTGLKAAQGDAVLFFDADGATPIEEIEKLWPDLRDGAGLVVGSRKIPGAHILVKQRLLRRTMGRVYQWICRLLLDPGVADVTCGFKLFTRQAVELCRSRMRIRRWSFDAELFTIAKAHRLKVAEVPIRWTDQRRTKVHLLKDSLGSFSELIRIRFYAARGAYR
ncbi:MAG: glycosyltransferase family 2 protein [Candidatus Omnitrophica bacterium]|nr:glycosyltransferase family 2 protein [Candidatus Omnitrophota bacterium]